MIDKVKMRDCVLCGSCIESCPVNAISFTRESFGFYYPVINWQLCLKCNKCEKSCPVLINSPHINDTYPVSFVAKNRNAEKRIKSTSGGIFIAAAECVLEQGGYVCGAIMNNNMQVHHICSNEVQTVKAMMGSKYLQSRGGGIKV